jgi:hypothetical protein
MLWENVFWVIRYETETDLSNRSQEEEPPESSGYALVQWLCLSPVAMPWHCLKLSFGKKM